MKRVTIIIPCFNEEVTLPLLWEEMQLVLNHSKDYSWEILFVNDGSNDNTISIIKGLSRKHENVRYLNLSRNFGKEAAILAGLDYMEGDCAIIMDADLQDPPRVILDMLSAWEEGYEDVYAYRTERGKESWLRKNLSLLYYSILKKSTNEDVLCNVGDFRLLDRKCINALKSLRETSRYTKGLYCWIGFKKKGIPLKRSDRIGGKSSWNLYKLFKFGIEGIISYTTSPLRLSTMLGLTVSIIAFIYMIIIFFKTIIFGEEVKGFPTLVLIILFLGGIQLLCIGIIGEYIARIFKETKNRPPYIISDKDER